GLCGCSTITAKHAGTIVSPEPENYAWWLRTEFVPVHKQIRGIPLQQLDSSWTLASELTKEAIPKELLYENGSDIMKENGVSFTRSDDLNHDGVDDLALIGVYQDEAGKRGSFILILTKDQTGNWGESFLEKLGKPTFAALSKKDPMEIWFCMYCDFGVDVLWDKEKGKYVLKSFQDEEGN
ncbi:hypothetical protein HY772_00805, partial [Candidatus Woesearchaeota archaeon]|nr:hypothetical protein [Candidatus Woesearchaeota archaeon]